VDDFNVFSYDGTRPKEDKMEIGTRIKALRVKKKLSQEALAAELNVSRQAVTKWENNTSKPSTANLLALCKIFDISLDELVSEKADEKEVKERGEKKSLDLKKVLLFSSIIFSLLSIVAILWNRHSMLPHNIIGYADEETGIVVSGTPDYLYLLCGFTIMLLIVTSVLFLRSKIRNGGNKREKE